MEHGRWTPINASDLLPGDVFRMPATGTRGTVLEVTYAVIGKRSVRAPRCLMVGARGVFKRTLHPQIAVEVDGRPARRARPTRAADQGQARDAWRSDAPRGENE